MKSFIDGYFRNWYDKNYLFLWIVGVDFHFDYRSCDMNMKGVIVSDVTARKGIVFIVVLVSTKMPKDDQKTMS